MADVEDGRVGGEGERAPVSHLRRGLLFLAVVLQLIGGVVPFGMELALLEIRHPNALRKLLLMVVPWTSLLTVIAVCIKKYEKRVAVKERGRSGSVVTHLRGYTWLCLLAALLHLAFSFFVWLRTINGWKFGGIFISEYSPIGFATLLLLVSVWDFCEDVCCH